MNLYYYWYSFLCLLGFKQSCLEKTNLDANIREKQSKVASSVKSTQVVSGKVDMYNPPDHFVKGGSSRKRNWVEKREEGK